jgi:hypothetical protein
MKARTIRRSGGSVGSVNYGPYQYQPPPPSSGNATAALVLGICGFTVCPLFCSIAAVIFAMRAYSEIDASGGQIRGRGQAQAGLILGWIGIGLSALFVLGFIALIAIGLAVDDGTSSTGGFDTIMPLLSR